MNYWLLASFCFSMLVSGERQAASEFVAFKELPAFQVKAGTVTKVPLHFVVKEGYHIQADKVKDENLIPSRLSITGEGFQVQMIEYPPAKDYQLVGTDETLWVFDGMFTIDLVVSTNKELERRPYSLNGKLFYQACDSIRCYFPRTLDFKMLVEVR